MWASNKDEPFFQGWQRHAVIAIAIIEVIIIIVFVLTELGNIASNFWLTNVFGGTWCGLVLLIHCVSLFVIGFCIRTPKAAFVTVIITIVALLTCALLISFKVLFLAQPSTCLLTPSCASQSVSTSGFSYTMSQNFFTAFNSLNGFKTYTLSQAKYLFQTVQLSFGCLGFVLCVVYLVLYFMRRKETLNRVKPINVNQDSRNSAEPRFESARNANASRSVRKPQRTSYVS